MPFCGQCGHKASDTDRFCVSCGRALPGQATAEAPLEFDASLDAKFKRLSNDARPAVSALRVPASVSPVAEPVASNEGPDWIPQWLNTLSYPKLFWGAGIGVGLSVIADVLRTVGDGWLASSRIFQDGVWVVSDEVLYSLGETAQNVGGFLKVLGVLLGFVAVVMILLRAMRKTLVGAK